jgi:hypothetical protein
MSLLFLSVPSWADEVDKKDAVIGGGVGGALGAVIGAELGDRNGAIVGSAVGAALGTAIATADGSNHDHPVVMEVGSPLIVIETHEHKSRKHKHKSHKKDHHCPPGQADKHRC